MKNKKQYTQILHSLTICMLPLGLGGCYFDFDDDDGFHGPSIVGSGNIIVEERSLSSFDQIEANGSFGIIISQGSHQMVEVEGDDNILPVITTRVRGGELEISNTRNYRTNNQVKVYITLPVVSSMELNGAGNIFGETILSGDLLNIELNGAGNVDLELDYTKLVAGGRGSGNFLLFGTVIDQAVQLSGSGNYNAKELISENCNIKISGSGNCEVDVSNKLEAQINGSGNITYYGNPAFVNSVINGSGVLIKRE